MKKDAVLILETGQIFPARRFGADGEIAAELVFGVTGSKGGLGWFIYRMRYSLDTAAVFSGLVTIILLGLAVDVLFSRLKAVTIKKWGMSI